MDDKYLFELISADDRTFDHMLRQLFQSAAEDAIADEVAERVLAPVLAKIQAGDFDESLNKARRKTALRRLMQAASYWHVLIIEN